MNATQTYPTDAEVAALPHIVHLTARASILEAKWVKAEARREAAAARVAELAELLEAAERELDRATAAEERADAASTAAQESLWAAESEALGENDAE